MAIFLDEYKCWFCDAAFSSALQLWLHSMIVHKGIKVLDGPLIDS